MHGALGVVDMGAAGALAWAQRRWAGIPLLDWIVRRASEAQHLAALVVVARGESVERVSELAPAGVTIVAAAADPLASLAAIVRRFPCRGVVRLRLGQPLMDPALIDRVAATAEAAAVDYVGYCRRDGRPTIHCPVGLGAEWCSAAAVLAADQAAREPADRADPTRFLLAHPERFALRLLPWPAPLDRDDVRLAVAGEDDWDHVQQVFDALGPDRLDWRRIAGLLEHQPALRERMAALNRASQPAH